MRASVLMFVAGIGILLGTGIADAEKVRTNQSTKLLARPGEQSKVLLTVKSGQNMTLLTQEGRWLRVRVNGRTGYVPRSKVDMADDGGIARNTRRRSFVDGRGKKRGFGGQSAPDDRVAADALGDGGESEDEGEDEDEAPPPKKTPPKPTPKVGPAPKVAAASKGKEDDEEDEEDDEAEEEAPPPKRPTPPSAKPIPAAKPAAATKVAVKASPAKGDDEEEEEEEEEDDGEEGGDKPTKADEDGEGKADEGEDEEEDGPAKPAAKESRKRARVSKKVSVREEPDSESDESFVVRPTDLLFPMKSEGNWTFVENADGDSGWIESDLLEVESGSGGSSGGRVIDIRVRGGITIIQQGMRTAGSSVLEVPDNYNIGTSSMTLALGAGIVIPRGKMLLGGEFTYDYAKTLGGGVFYDPDGTEGPMMGSNIGITLHNVNFRGLLGIDLKKKSGMALFGRLGYRYQGFLVADVVDFTKNTARLPSEVVKAPTLGAALSIPRLTNKIGMRFSLDSILFAASVKQTVGLEDGTAPSVKAIVLGAGFTYHLGSIDVLANYDLNYMAIGFGPPSPTSMRNHMGTSVSRTDIFHMLTFGIGKPF